MIENASYIACVTSFGIGTCFMLNTTTKEIKNDMNSINKAAHANSMKDHLYIVNQLREFVELHSQAKQLRELFEHSKIMSFSSLKVNNLKFFH